MKFLALYWGWIVLLISVVIFVSGLSAVIEGWIDGKERVQKGPREEMYWCHLHGVFRKKHCLALFPDLGGKAVNSFVCPMCYKKNVFDDVDAKLRMN